MLKLKHFDTLDKWNILLKLISSVSFYFCNVATRKLESIFAVHIILLLNRASL